MKTILIVALFFVAVQAKQLINFRQESDSNIHHGSVQAVQQTVDIVASAPKYPAPRVISGNQAARGQFPYQAALYLNGRSFCGGSLISTRWVLTAAHCASGISTFIVYLGSQNLNNANEDGRVIIETSSKIVHPSYSSILISNDIAVVNLNQDVQLNKLIQTIPLTSGPELYEGTVARVSGWGKTSDDSNAVNPQLNYVDLTIISNDLCRQTFGIYIRSSNICTKGVGDRGVCNGDSGGPLIDSSNGKQIGIASFVSSAGCQSANPNGFVRVSSFADWITENTGISI